jgi:hypothetical protein
LKKKTLSIKVNYVGGSFNVPAKNYKTIAKFTKKMCRRYSLGKDVVITDEECRVYNLNIILEYCPEELWICIVNNGSIIKVELKRFEYEIFKDSYYHNFNVMICSAWNYLTLRKYINLLVGGDNRLMEIYVDGNLWSEYDLAVNVTRMKIKALLRKKDKSGRYVRFWIAKKETLEIWD